MYFDKFNNLFQINLGTMFLQQKQFEIETKRTKQKRINCDVRPRQEI